MTATSATTTTTGRRIVGWASVSLDGGTSGPGGPAEGTWLDEHDGRPPPYEGVWLGITADPATVSSTLDEAAWANSRIVRDLESEVRSLRGQPGRDALVLDSASVIQELLRLDLLDDRWQAIVPSIVGGGLRLLPDGLPPSRGTLAASATLSHGAVVVHHQREREASRARRAAARRSRAAS